MNITKSQFLKGSVASAFAIGSVASASAKALTPDTKWDDEADVVVIGFGGAGASAAITAHDAGSNVLIIEKMDAPGGNTAVSAGGFMIPDDINQARKYLAGSYQYCHAEMDEQLLDAFCKGTGELRDWLTGLGDNVGMFVYGYAGFKNLEGADTIKRYRIRGQKGGPKKGSGDCLFDLLKGAVEKRGIRTMLSTPVVAIIRDGDEVVGVEVQKNGQKQNIKAKKGVVLATGGYEFDPESLQNYTMGYGIGAIGNPGNTGDGLRLAQSMGAKLWHMNAYSAFLGVRYPGYKTSVSISPKGAGYIWVDQDGKRFSSEKVDGHCQMYVASHLDAVRHCYPRIPCYLIFDQATADKGPMGSGLGSGYAINREGHRWSKDLSKEVEMGLLKKANSIAELSKMLNLPEGQLEKTVEKWNTDVKAGKDTEFGRPIRAKGKGSYTFDGPEISAPIENGPFYAVELYPTLVNTQGGPRKNVKGQVLDAFGNPIPRLYVAGELGSMWGPIYQGACNNAESMVFGRIAGANVAQETPLK
ncbi:FAD-dependent oxidoreductase [Turicimonas muris]|uniref:FAD-dependent oxidoreductase n=2 Tax=Turicimonas muris TaxID=1796652 RepID=UPI0023F43784|nr:FAD-dependent oxidoreductase [Turicimonas muris]